MGFARAARVEEEMPPKSSRVGVFMSSAVGGGAAAGVTDPTIEERGLAFGRVGEAKGGFGDGNGCVVRAAGPFGATGVNVKALLFEDCCCCCCCFLSATGVIGARVGTEAGGGID